MVCYREFEQTHGLQNHCEDCRKTRNKQFGEGVCQGCGEVFQKRRHPQFFCNTACRRAFQHVGPKDNLRRLACLQRNPEWPEIEATISRLKSAWQKKQTADIRESEF